MQWGVRAAGCSQAVSGLHLHQTHNGHPATTRLGLWSIRLVPAVDQDALNLGCATTAGRHPSLDRALESSHVAGGAPVHRHVQLEQRDAKDERRDGRVASGATHAAVLRRVLDGDRQPPGVRQLKRADAELSLCSFSSSRWCTRSWLTTEGMAWSRRPGKSTHRCGGGRAVSDARLQIGVVGMPAARARRRDTDRARASAGA